MKVWGGGFAKEVNSAESISRFQVGHTRCDRFLGRPAQAQLLLLDGDGEELGPRGKKNWDQRQARRAPRRSQQELALGLLLLLLLERGRQRGETRRRRHTQKAREDSSDGQDIWHLQEQNEAEVTLSPVCSWRPLLVRLPLLPKRVSVRAQKFTRMLRARRVRAAEVEPR